MSKFGRLLAVPILVGLAFALSSSAVLASGRGAAPGKAQCPVLTSLGAPLASVTINSDVSTGTVSADGDNIRVANITVAHGATSSTHDITYEDNDDSGSLTCLDQVLSFD